jgi:hypothetical protein
MSGRKPLIDSLDTQQFSSPHQTFFVPSSWVRTSAALFPNVTFYTTPHLHIHAHPVVQASASQTIPAPRRPLTRVLRTVNAAPRRAHTLHTCCVAQHAPSRMPGQDRHPVSAALINRSDTSREGIPSTCGVRSFLPACTGRQVCVPRSLAETLCILQDAL